MVPVARLQTYLRQNTARQCVQIAVPPFTLFLHPHAVDPCASFATPNQPLVDDLPLARLRAAFAEHQRQPCFQFVDAFTPGLAQVLQAAGFVEALRTPLMVCTPQTYRPAPPVPGLTMKVLTAGSSLADIREGLDANAFGFDPQAARSTDVEAEAFRSGLTTNRAFTALLDGQSAGAGMFNPPLEGVAELVGIATLQQFRRRGVAAFLTAYATQVAFELGVEVVFLGVADEQAGRVYERVGFRPYAYLLAFTGSPDV